MNKESIILITLSMILLGMTFQTVSAQEQPQTAAKSVAWYVANIKDVKAQNRICHDNPALQNSENCQSALHALQISFKAGN